MVTLYLKSRGQVTVRVHHLVLETFVGPCPDGMESCHRDDDPTNNWVDNLRWDTRQANVNDKMRNGHHRCGERTYNAKLTEEQVISIRRRASEGESKKSLAAEFGVKLSTIYCAINGNNWKHVGKSQ